MIITNAQGKTLGNIELSAEERAARLITSARIAALEARTQERAARREGYPLLAQARKARESVSKAARRMTYAVLALVALGLVVSACSEEPAVASAQSAQPELTATYSGSTLADANNGWQGVSTASNGNVLLNGIKVDNVLDTESPLRERYLDSFDANGLPRGIEDVTVGEGIRFCADLDNGSVVALREASDTRTDVPTFSTSERRLVLAAASMVNFCPRFA